MTADSGVITVLDWRQVGADLLQPCYSRERVYWRDVLAWDTAWTWTTVEEARVTWGLPGLVAMGRDGRPAGWTFYLVEDRVLRVGALVAETAAVTRAIVARIVEQARAERVDVVSCFVAHRADGLRDALEAHGFACEPFHYLHRDLKDYAGIAPDGTAAAEAYERWDGDAVAAAGLLASAYERQAALHFTAGGTLEEWHAYVRQLVEQPACGTFDPECTLTVRDANGLAALAVVTALAPETAHLAQMAVRRDCQGHGLACRLLDAVLQRVVSAGRSTMTLLVGDTNRAASHVYVRAGFTPRAQFLAGRLSLLSAPVDTSVVIALKN